MTYNFIKIVKFNDIYYGLAKKGNLTWESSGEYYYFTTKQIILLKSTNKENWEETSLKSAETTRSYFPEENHADLAVCGPYMYCLMPGGYESSSGNTTLWYTADGSQFQKNQSFNSQEGYPYMFGYQMIAIKNVLYVQRPSSYGETVKAFSVTYRSDTQNLVFSSAFNMPSAKTFFALPSVSDYPVIFLYDSSTYKQSLGIYESGSWQSYSLPELPESPSPEIGFYYDTILELNNKIIVGISGAWEE